MACEREVLDGTRGCDVIEGLFGALETRRIKGLVAAGDMGTDQWGRVGRDVTEKYMAELEALHAVEGHDANPVSRTLGTTVPADEFRNARLVQGRGELRHVPGQSASDGNFARKDLMGLKEMLDLVCDERKLLLATVKDVILRPLAPNQ